MNYPDLDRRDLEGASLWQLRDLAAERLPEHAWGYLRSGAADSISAEESHEALARLRLIPRVLRNVSDVDTRVELFDHQLPHPVLLAPTGCHRLMHPEGELATSRGAAAAGVPMMVSTYTTTPMPMIAEHSPQGWFLQLNPFPDHAFNRSLIHQAHELGATGVVVSVDTPVPGPREGQRWNGVDLPTGVRFGILADYPEDIVPEPGVTSIYRPTLDAAFTWNDLAELIAWSPLLVVVKGVLHPEDAVLAVRAGASALVVSNHGGRNLDTVLTPLACLPGVMASVRGAIPVLYDGGIRRGTDVLKVLALGVTAVMIGRPYLWGLAVGGAAGVTYVLDKLVAELRSAMALCGAADLNAIAADLLAGQPVDTPAAALPTLS